jgi:hypothetical protein
MLNLKSTLLKTVVLTASLYLTACGQSPMLTQVSQPVQIQSTHSKRQLIIKFKYTMSSAAMSEFNAKYGFHALRSIPEINAQIIEVDATIGLKLEQIIGYLKTDPSVAYAETNGRLSNVPVPIMNVKPIFN